jgi:hypothetical protein
MDEEITAIATAYEALRKCTPLEQHRVLVYLSDRVRSDWRQGEIAALSVGAFLLRAGNLQKDTLTNG